MTKASSIKEALNAATVSCSGTEITIQCSGHDVKDAIFNGLEALALSPPAGERREAIARLWDKAWNSWLRHGRHYTQEEADNVAIDILASGLVQDEAGWHDISTAPKNALKVTSETLLLANFDKKWIRFGKWYVQEGCWYYSGTNERSQYAQVRGDDPTHWMPMPAIRSARDGGAES